MYIGGFREGLPHNLYHYVPHFSNNKGLVFTCHSFPSTFLFQVPLDLALIDNGCHYLNCRGVNVDSRFSNIHYSLTLQEYILKGVVNAALGQEQGSVSRLTQIMSLYFNVFWVLLLDSFTLSDKLPLVPYTLEASKELQLQQQGSETYCSLKEPKAIAAPSEQSVLLKWTFILCEKETTTAWSKFVPIFFCSHITSKINWLTVRN